MFEEDVVRVMQEINIWGIQHEGLQRFEKSNIIEDEFQYQQNLPIYCTKQLQIMDIRDFQGLTKFKVIIPLVYILSWISMFMGPSFFPVTYQQFTIGIMIYTIIKILNVFVGTIILTIKSQEVFRRAKNPEEGAEYKNLHDVGEQINYGFVIPSYKQEIELLSETLQVLAAHKRAKTNYMIFLAMQAHETDCEKKAHHLIQAFSGYFRAIEYTKHEIRQYEQKGKASNVSWCVEHLEPVFEKYMINPDSVILTILDADSWAPDLYYDFLQQKIYDQYDERHNRLWFPTQIFTRNNLDVPLLTRLYDILHSFAHATNSYSCFNLTYPLSNYTISYSLMKKIGFWDTCADAIGEDFHTAQKVFWKTNGQVKMKPIYVCFNQVNISTGNGYCEDLKARFWQAERHAKGVADVAYSLKMLLNQPFRLKNLIITYHVLETFVIIALTPWITISLTYQDHILYHYTDPSPQLYSNQSVEYLFTVMTIFGTISYLLFEIFKRRSNSLIYKQENQSILRILEYLIFFLVVFFFMAVPSFVLAAFRTLFGKQEYVVAQKKNTSKKQII